MRLEATLRRQPKVDSTFSVALSAYKDEIADPAEYYKKICAKDVPFKAGVDNGWGCALMMRRA